MSLPSHPGFLAPSLQGTPLEKVFSLRLVEDQTSQLPAADVQHHLRSAQLVPLTFGQSLFVQSESPCRIFPSKMSHRYPYILATWEKRFNFPPAFSPLKLNFSLFSSSNSHKFPWSITGQSEVQSFPLRRFLHIAVR